MVSTDRAEFLWHVTSAYIEHADPIIACAEKTILPYDRPPYLGPEMNHFCWDAWWANLVQAKSLCEANSQTQERPGDTGILLPR
jgi:hypothetical protein